MIYEGFEPRGIFQGFHAKPAKVVRRGEKCKHCAVRFGDVAACMIVMNAAAMVAYFASFRKNVAHCIRSVMHAHELVVFYANAIN